MFTELATELTMDMDSLFDDVEVLEDDEHIEENELADGSSWKRARYDD